jgi:hypothetical protein
MAKKGISDLVAVQKKTLGKGFTVGQGR